MAIKRVLVETKVKGARFTRWEKVEEVVPIEAIASALEHDPNPTLSNNLELNGHCIVGELDNDCLVVDGGLL